MVGAQNKNSIQMATHATTKASVAREDAPIRRTRLATDKSRAIVRAARKLFLKKGYGAVSMNEIVKRVGGSKTTIYSRFRDKAGLFAAVIDELLSETVDFNLVMDVSNLEVRAALLQVARQHLEVVMSDLYIRLIRLVAAEVDRFPDLGRLFWEHGPGRTYINFSLYLRQQVRAGTLSIDDVGLATDFFFGALHHRRVLARIYGVEVGIPPNCDHIAHGVVEEFMRSYAVVARDSAQPQRLRARSV